jgi:predicted histidine transporter YuiF (NhaC family)
MSITTQSTSITNRSTHPNIVHYTNNITNIVDNDNKTLVIILAVTLPTLAVIGLLISLILCYRRRRYTKSWLKRFELENSSRLQTIVVNLPPTSIQPQYMINHIFLSYDFLFKDILKKIFVFLIHNFNNHALKL